jgi:hypothetical protein
MKLFWKSPIGKWYNRNAFGIHLIIGHIWYVKIVWPLRELQKNISNWWCEMAHGKIVVQHPKINLTEYTCLDCGRHWMERKK